VIRNLAEQLLMATMSQIVALCERFREPMQDLKNGRGTKPTQLKIVRHKNTLSTKKRQRNLHN
jgi:hypothetical protein